MAQIRLPIGMQLPITNGPSKFDFIACLFKKGNPVTFTIKRGETEIMISVDLTAAEAEDGSRDSWIMRGCFERDGDGSFKVISFFKGYYDMRDRTGHITFRS